MRVHYKNVVDDNDHDVPSADDDFELFVADCNNHRVQVLNGKTGAWIRNIGAGEGNKDGELNEPSDIEIVGNEIYVLENGNSRISVFNLDDDGKFVRHVGNNNNSNNDSNTNNSNNGDDCLLSCPCGFKLFENQLFVADRGNDTIKVYGPSVRT